MSEHVDSVVVGSGFGGSVAAWRLAEAGKEVVVLERGKAWAPGSFPRRPHEIAKSFWDPSRGLHGLLNVWSFKNLGAIVSSGLGGGSLIYANVLLRKDERWFCDELPNGESREWPIAYEQLVRHYERVERLIAAEPYPFVDLTAKTRAMREAAQQLAQSGTKATWSLPPLAIAFRDAQGTACPGAPLVEAHPNLHGATRSTCRLCGECNLGCNYGSKNTLDHCVLSDAKRRGADIRTRVEVRRIARNGDGYEVGYVCHRDDCTDTRALPILTITCKRLVLAAGALGSTYLLLRNRAAFPGLSDRVGHCFNGNGDLLGLVLDAREPGARQGRVLDGSHGPVITSAIRIADERDGDGARGSGFYVEDAGYPQFVDWIAQGTHLDNVLQRIERFAHVWLRKHFSQNPSCDLGADLAELFGGDAARTWLPLLGMGRESPHGCATLDDRNQLSVDWSLDRAGDYFDRVQATMQGIASALHGKFEKNPLSYLQRVLTVHPLGGCPMGRNPREGVVSSDGEVFGHPGFYIADGSVMPGPVGPNPALTIAACADHFADHMLR